MRTLAAILLIGFMAVIVWADEKPADVPPPPAPSDGKEPVSPPSPPEGKLVEPEKKDGDRQGKHLWWGPRWGMGFGWGYPPYYGYPPYGGYYGYPYWG